MKVYIEKYDINRNLIDTLVLNDTVYGNYVLGRKTKIYGNEANDYIGYEWNGADGGYPVGIRRERKPVTLDFIIREIWSTDISLTVLIKNVKKFFAPYDNQSANLYFFNIYYVQCGADFTVYDANNPILYLKYGTISVEPIINIDGNSCKANASVSFLFGNPFLHEHLAPYQDNSINTRIDLRANSFTATVNSLTSVSVYDPHIIIRGTLGAPTDNYSEVINTTNDTYIIVSNGYVEAGDVIETNIQGLPVYTSKVGWMPAKRVQSTLRLDPGINTFELNTVAVDDVGGVQIDFTGNI